MKQYIYSWIFLLLLVSVACTRNHPTEAGQTQEARWEKIESRVRSWSNSNLDSMHFYSNLLYKEAVKAKDLRWEAKGLVLLGDWNSMKNESDSATILFQKAIIIADSIHDSAIIINAHILLGSRYLGTGLYQKAQKEFLTGLKYAESTHDTNKIAGIYNNLGNVAEYLNNLEKAQYYMNKAITIAEKTRDTLVMASSMRNLALVVKKSGDSALANRYLRSSLALFSKIHNASWIAKIYTDFGINYRYTDPDSALYYYKKAIEIYQSLGKEGTILITRFNMANLLKDKGNYREAEKLFLQIYKTTVRENNLIGQAYSSFSLSDVYRKMKDYQKAGFFIQRAKELGIQWNQPEFMISVYSGMIEINKAQGKYKEAVASYERHDYLKDSLSNAENKSRILELQNQFDSEKKEFEIKELKQQTAIQQDKLRDRFVLIIGLLVILALISLSLGVILFFYRKSANANQKLSVQSEELKKEIGKREKIQQHLAESEQQLLKLNAAKDKFFSLIAHDLKNPFTTIFGYSELLATDLLEFDQQEIRQFLENISNASKQAYMLLENLLIWAQTQNRTIEFKPEVIDLQAQVNSTIALVETQARTKNISVSSTIKEPQPVFADTNLVGSILRNLLSNAIKFTPQEGMIEVSTTTAGKFTEISVKDTGVGIEKEHLVNIFNLENKRRTMGTDKEKGSGLGLTLCKEFVAMQGGQIWVESEPGKGTTFTFSVPAAN
jgi:signal transduction histidine kinase